MKETGMIHEYYLLKEAHIRQSDLRNELRRERLARQARQGRRTANRYGKLTIHAILAGVSALAASVLIQESLRGLVE